MICAVFRVRSSKKKQHFCCKNVSTKQPKQKRINTDLRDIRNDMKRKQDPQLSSRQARSANRSSKASFKHPKRFSQLFSLLSRDNGVYP